MIETLRVVLDCASTSRLFAISAFLFFKPVSIALFMGHEQCN